MNNKYIDNKLKEFREKFPGLYTLGDEVKEVEQFIKEALEQAIDEGMVQVGKNLLDIKPEQQLPKPKERKLIDPEAFEKHAKGFDDEEECEHHCHKPGRVFSLEHIDDPETCTHCQKQEECQCCCHQEPVEVEDVDDSLHMHMCCTHCQKPGEDWTINSR